MDVLGQGGNVFASIRPFVCPFLREQDYAKRFQDIFIKPSAIIDYCYGNNPLNFGVVITQYDRMTAILKFCYNILYINHTQYRGAT